MSTLAERTKKLQDKVNAAKAKADAKAKYDALKAEYDKIRKKK